jgi:diaminohydroxyphosphoribosylaminopyrimidine deaminase/5-amino-6-(5-phosphoribosylamino)uracil reductase
MDAIVVGIGTALADDPELTARPPGPRTPLRVVLDCRARLPLPSKLVTTAREVPVLVAVSSEATPDRLSALRDAGCEVVACGPAISIEAVLKELARRGATNVLVEGGGRVLGSFLDADQIDAVDVFIAPMLEGGPPAFTPLQGRGVDRMSKALRLIDPCWQGLDGDLRFTARVAQPWLFPEGQATGT